MKNAVSNPERLSCMYSYIYGCLMHVCMPHACMYVSCMCGNGKCGSHMREAHTYIHAHDFSIKCVFMCARKGTRWDIYMRYMHAYIYTYIFHKTHRRSSP